MRTPDPVSTMTPQAPPRDPRGRRHPMKIVTEARRLYEGGWGISQIRDFLAQDGHAVSDNTIRYWVIPGLDEHQRRENLARYHRRRRAEGKVSETPMLDRMLALREVGLSFPAIGGLMRLDHGLRMTAEQVRYYVNERREPHRPKRLAS